MTQQKPLIIDAGTIKDLPTGDQLSVNAGSAAAPAITFGDADTGLLSPGANEVAISTNGAQRVTVDGSGRLGVGTSTPATVLDVVGGGRFVASTGLDALAVTNAVDTTFSFNIVGGGQVRLKTDLAGRWFSLADGAGNVDTMVVRNGRVSVGSTNPAYQFTVQNGAPGIAIDGASAAIGGTFGTGGNTELRAEPPTSTTGASVWLGGSTRGDADKNATKFNINNVEYMRIDGNAPGHTLGNVGIGTSVPSDKLSVYDATLARVAVTSNADSQIMLESGGGPSAYPAWLSYGHRGTIASPSPTQSGDTLGGFFFGGYSGAANTARVTLVSKATENWSASGIGSNLVFSIMPANTATFTSIEAFRLTPPNIGSAVDGEVVVNESGLSNLNFRVESQGNANMLFVDASADAVGVAQAAPTSKLHVGGSLALAITTISGTTTLDATHYTVLCNTAGSGFTVNLPAAATCPGRVYVIKNIDTNTATVQGNGVEKIDAANTYALSSQWQSVTVQSDGNSAWYVIG